MAEITKEIEEYLERDVVKGLLHPLTPYPSKLHFFMGLITPAIIPIGAGMAAIASMLATVFFLSKVVSEAALPSEKKQETSEKIWLNLGGAGIAFSCSLACAVIAVASPVLLSIIYLSKSTASIKQSLIKAQQLQEEDDELPAYILTP